MVIGETTARVHAVAQALGGITYEPAIKLASWFPRGAKIWLNERWLEFQIRAGALILDIGPDFERRLVQGASAYYLAELKLADRLGADVISIAFRGLAGVLVK